MFRVVDEDVKSNLKSMKEYSAPNRLLGSLKFRDVNVVLLLLLTNFTTKRLSVRDNLSYISTRTLVRGDSSALKRNKYLSGLDEYSRTVYIPVNSV